MRGENYAGWEPFPTPEINATPTPAFLFLYQGVRFASAKKSSSAQTATAVLTLRYFSALPLDTKIKPPRPAALLNNTIHQKLVHGYVGGDYLSGIQHGVFAVIVGYYPTCFTKD